MKSEKKMILSTLLLFLALMTMANVTVAGDLSVIYSDKAPKPIGPYSQAIVANGFIFAAGQIAINPETGKLVEPDITIQTKQVLENLKAVLKAAGASLKDVVKVSVFLQNPKDFKLVYDRLANLDFCKIRMGWIEEIIIFIRHNDARHS